jgi:hypothetical protein
MTRAIYLCVICGLALCACTAPKRSADPARTVPTVPTVPTTTQQPEPTTTAATTTTTAVPATTTLPRRSVSQTSTTSSVPEPRVAGTSVTQQPSGDDTAIWVAIAQCEQPGNGWMGVRWDHPGPTYQGGLGFWYGTWDSYKRGTSAAAIDNAGDATPAQQMEVARRVRAAHGYGAWGCGRKLGYA